MATRYKQPGKVSLPNNRDPIKNFYWRVERWGKDENTGKAYVEVLHWFVKDEPLTSGPIHERYEKSLAGDPNLSKVETYLLTLTQYNGSNVQ